MNFSMLSKVPQQHRSALTRYRANNLRYHTILYYLQCAYQGSSKQLTNAANNGTICYNNRAFLVNIII
jgi:hypothetical protein